MDAGRLNHRAQFLRKAVDATDEYGNPMQEYAPMFTVWANVRETTGKERVAAGSIENLRTATIRIRSSSETRGLTEGDQVQARGKTWDILGIANADDKGVMLDLLVQAGGAV
jgi:SPP1 family predicted phage head-tail adaptor